MKNKNRNNLIEKIVIAMFFFTLIFVNTGITNQGTIFVQHIVGEKSNIILFIGIIGFLFFIIKSSLKFNRISIFLIIRFIVFIVSNIIIYVFGFFNTNFQYGIVLAYFLSFCYFVIGSSSDNKEYLTKLCIISIVIITIQLLITFFGRTLVYSDVINMKWWMFIPLGQTNTVGCYLIGMFTYANSSCKNKKINIILAILTLISILLTYSRSGLIMYIVFISYIILKDLKNNKKFLVIKVLFVLLMIGFATVIILVNDDYKFERFSFESMSNSRIKVYTEGIDLFLNNILLGVGAYEYHIYDAYKAHNWILETFIENGIIGALLFFLIIKECYINMKKISPEMTIFMIFYLIHGLVEPNLYTANFDAFFWLLIGSCLFNDSFLEGKDEKYEDSL